MDDQQVNRRRLPLIAQAIWLPFWWLLHFFMILAIPVGIGSAVLGTVSFVVDLGEGFWTPRLGDAPARTITDKTLFTVAGAAVGIVGIGFLWLRQRGYVRGAVLYSAATIGVYVLIAWMTGKSGISGGPFHFGQ